MAQKLAQGAATHLDNGNEVPARADLDRALQADPGNRLAQNLLRQITADPVALLGRESFSYVVKPNDTISSIAARFLNDSNAFYILARYNGIAVPRQIAGGQTIRIPGKTPVVSSVAPKDAVPRNDAGTAPPPLQPPQELPAPPTGQSTAAAQIMLSAEAAERAGDLERALLEYRKAAALGHALAEAKAERLRKQLVSQHSQAARSALPKQDLDTCIREWDRVINLDPGNDAARYERQRCVDLKTKLETLPQRKG